MYNIKNSLNGGVQTDDFSLTDRQLEFIVDHFRAKLAAQRLNAGKGYQGFVDVLRDIPFKRTDDFVSSGDLIVFRSVDRLPTAVNTYAGEAITFIGYNDSFTPFQRTTVNNFNIEAYSKYGKYKPKWFMDDNYMYVVMLDYINTRHFTVRGVFEKPRAVIEFNTGVPSTGDYRYPIPMNVLDELNGLIFNNEVNWLNVVPKDLINDSIDE